MESPRSARTTWLLDLDNTLHDCNPVVFPRIDAAMTEFVGRTLGIDRAQADALRLHYWRRYGATLLGLVRHHGVDPHAFLRDVHPFPDLARIVSRDGALAQALRRLPGRKVVLTNAPRAYAMGVLGALGVLPWIDGVVTIEAMRFAGRFQPKPSRAMLRRVVASLRTVPSRCVLVEDSVVNLRAARAVGLRTVLVTAHSHRRSPATDRPRAGAARGVHLQVPFARELPRCSARFLRRSAGASGPYHR